MTVYAAPGPRAWRARPGCRWRDLTGFCQDQEPLCLAWVEAAVHVAAGLEGRNDLFGHRDLGAMRGVSSRRAVPLFTPETPKPRRSTPFPRAHGVRDGSRIAVNNAFTFRLDRGRVFSAILSIK